ncbi:MAG: MazG family protein [Acidobacteriota bacterium]
MEQDNRWNKVRRVWEIVDSLRGEPGCPWDKKQTPESVQTYLIEEAHEAAAAIRTGDFREAAEELGDVLFMVLFLAYMYEERGDFSLEDVCDTVAEKMIRRHPHVFGDVEVNSVKEVKDNWEKIKAGEKEAEGRRPKSSIPESLPSLVRAYRMIARLSQKDEERWNDVEATSKRFFEKSRDLHERVARGESVPPQAFGEMLASVVNLARLKGYRSEDCLHETLRGLEASESQD